MNIEYMNPFVSAACSVLDSVLGGVPEMGEPAMQPSMFASQQCNVVCGVTGQVQGQVVYAMSLATADRIASVMLDHAIQVFDQLAASAIGELGSMISGHAVQGLAENGFACDMTPPTIIRGSNVKISTISIAAVVVPITLAQGGFFITVGLQGRK